MPSVGHTAVVTPSMAEAYLNRAEGIIHPFFALVIGRYAPDPSKYPSFDMQNFGAWILTWDDYYRKTRSSYRISLEPHAIYHEVDAYLETYLDWRQKAIDAKLVTDAPKPDTKHESGSGLGIPWTPILIVAGGLLAVVALHEVRKVVD